MQQRIIRHDERRRQGRAAKGRIGEDSLKCGLVAEIAEDPRRGKSEIPRKAHCCHEGQSVKSLTIQVITPKMIFFILMI